MIYLAFSQSLVTRETKIGNPNSLPPFMEIPRVPSDARDNTTVLSPDSTL